MVTTLETTVNDTGMPTKTVQVPVTDECVQVDAALLSGALHKFLHKTVATRTTLPVLENVCIRVRGDRMTLETTNLEVGGIVTLPCESSGDLDITVPHKLFAETVGKVGVRSGGTVLMTTNMRTRCLDIETNINGIPAKGKIKGISADEFPIMPDLSELGVAYTINAKALQRVATQVAYAASPDNSRPVLASVLLRFGSKGGLIAAAADGFTLAKRTEWAVINHTFADRDILIPSPSLYHIAKFAKLGLSDTVEVKVTGTGNQVLFSTPSGTHHITTRTVEGNYVDIERVIPTDWATRATVSVPKMLAVAKQLAKYCKDSPNISRWAYNAEEWEIIGAANAAEVGDTSIRFDAEIEGSDTTIALNVNYVIDALSSFEGETAYVQLKTSGSPAVFISEDKATLAIVMPMYLANR